MTAWAIVMIVLSALAWGGQTLSAVAPHVARRFSLIESEADVDPVFWADIRAEAAWDALTLWTTLAAGVLLLADVSAWAYLGLVGGGMYLYFAGRGISARRQIRDAGHRAGTETDIRNAMVMLTIWGVMAGVTIVLAATDLATGS